MYWRILSIKHLWPSKRDDILPGGEFVIYHKKKKQTVSGWLPSHHPDVLYGLTISNTGNRIVEIHHIETTKKKGKPILEQYIKKLNKKKAENYLKLANYSRESMALWTVSVMYSPNRIPFDIEKTFIKLTQDMTHICNRAETICRKELIYNYEESKNIINRGLIQLGETPNSDTWQYLKELIEWQANTRWDTATFKCPNINHIEKYKGKWADRYDIEMSRKLSRLFKPVNTKTMQGSPCSSKIPKDACIIFRNVEDVYKWKCRVDHGNLYLFQKIYPEEKYKMLGIPDCQTLPQKIKHLFVAYSHLWSMEEWLKFKEVIAGMKK